MDSNLIADVPKLRPHRNTSLQAEALQEEKIRKKEGKHKNNDLP